MNIRARVKEFFGADDPMQLGERLARLRLDAARYAGKVAAHVASKEEAKPSKIANVQTQKRGLARGPKAYEDANSALLAILNEEIEKAALLLLAGDLPDEMPTLPGENQHGRDLRILRGLQRACDYAASASKAAWLNRGIRERASRLEEWRACIYQTSMAIIALQRLNARRLRLAKEIKGKSSIALPCETAVHVNRLLGTHSWTIEKRVPEHFSVDCAEWFRSVIAEGICSHDELEAGRTKGENDD